MWHIELRFMVRCDSRAQLIRIENRCTWAASLDWQRDFWHIPEFFELLTEQQEEYTKAITGQQDAKVTLDNIARLG